MNKRLLISLGVLLLGAMPLLSQDAQSKKMVVCSGAIGSDGQSFTCDKDHHVWKVANPAVLRDMEGQQAKLTYHRTSNADEIFVTSASVIQQQPQTAAHNPGDSAFRR
ncbi:MAG TPA: hypothetical protein VJN93_09335 [Candidatus Acidoferrum sp.]|nr:hypothetical protein [Candidatus Acidoferrum sp.]